MDHNIKLGGIDIAVRDGISIIDNLPDSYISVTLSYPCQVSKGVRRTASKKGYCQVLRYFKVECILTFASWTQPFQSPHPFFFLFFFFLVRSKTPSCSIQSAFLFSGTYNLGSPVIISVPFSFLSAMSALASSKLRHLFAPLNCTTSSAVNPFGGS